MCTVSWIASPGGYELFMNRDELRERLPAQPPRLFHGDTFSYLAPTDGDAGGSWVAVNEQGLTVALLNRYDPAPHPAAEVLRSRGLLLTDLVGLAEDGDDARRRLRTLDLERYRPFTLVLLEGGEPAQALVWNGQELSEPWNPTAPLASSSYDPDGIQAFRRGGYQQLVGSDPDRETLLAYHRSHHPERGPYSPCMHRANASTVSFTWIRVTPEDVTMAYADGPPCRIALGPALTLARHAEKIPA